MKLNQKLAQPVDIDHASATQDKPLETDEKSYEEAFQLKYQREIAIKLFILALAGNILKALGALELYPLVWIPILLPPLFTILTGVWQYIDKDIRRRDREDKY